MLSVKLVPPQRTNFLTHSQGQGPWTWTWNTMWPWAEKFNVKVASKGYNSVEVIKVYKPTKFQLWTGYNLHSRPVINKVESIVFPEPRSQAQGHQILYRSRRTHECLQTVWLMYHEWFVMNLAKRKLLTPDGQTDRQKVFANTPYRNYELSVQICI